MTLNEATLINETSLTINTEAGIIGGSGAQILNSGTLTVNGQDWASNYGLIAARERQAW